MDSQNNPTTLTFTGSAWPARIGGISIFICTVGVFFYFPNTPVYVPGITFVFMVLAILLSADVQVTADSSARIFTITKKRILASSQVVYPYDDIYCFCQVTTTSTNQKGEEVKNTSYAIGLNSQTTTTQPSYQGRKLISIPIPKGGASVVSSLAGNTIEFSRATSLANFIGVPFYIKGSEHDTLVNFNANIPRYTEEIKKLPETMSQIKDIMAQAKVENDRVAQEILSNQANNKI